MVAFVIRMQSLSISLNICFGAVKNHLIDKILLSTHNMFWFINEKTNF